MNYGNETEKDAGTTPADDAEEQFEQKTPALMKLASGSLIEVEDWFIDDGGRICVYMDSRKNGIDARFQDEFVILILKSREAAAAALGMSMEEVNQEVEEEW